MTTIKEFTAKNEGVRPNSDIQQRWETRVVAGGLHLRGAAGADAYISQFGNGMKSPKAVMFARMAELNGFQKMADRFWEQAYFLETGINSRISVDTNQPVVNVELPRIALKDSFGQNPELLSPISEIEAMRLIGLPDYALQEKKNGRRLMIRSFIKDAGVHVVGGNKKGLCVVPPLGISDAISALNHEVELDGENVNGVFWVFDLLKLDQEDYKSKPYNQRYDALRILISKIKTPHTHAVRLVPAFTDYAEKICKADELKLLNAEGYVLKPLHAAYTPGDGAQRKFQFRARGTFISGARNGSKNSVALSLLRADGSLRSMGNLTIPGSTPIPAIGSILEVEYLYCHKGPAGKLHQPVFLEERTDTSDLDCQESKLQVEPSEDD